MQRLTTCKYNAIHHTHTFFYEVRVDHLFIFLCCGFFCLCTVSYTQCCLYLCIVHSSMPPHRFSLTFIKCNIYYIKLTMFYKDKCRCLVHTKFILCCAPKLARFIHIDHFNYSSICKRLVCA